MSTDVQIPVTGNSGRAPTAAPTSSADTSLLPRFVALLTPLFAIAAGWLPEWTVRHTGAHLDQTGIVSFMIAAATAAFGSALKWLHGWQQYEARAAQRSQAARSAGSVSTP